ncbi:hypothetical protein AXK57_21585 [Tsukamurella pulmonis]|uniref:phage upper tail fiber protein n=1 Tax=Tsukamurella pulmonis TaxID=47312 RepID=UPI0007927AFF|nr:hypothetical protein [Tsukamurella pulmonis]KXP11678.1 hypothetical protein AXK57_21585 [Tsukamurella pulmonis]
MSTPLDWSDPDLSIEVPSTDVSVLDAPSIEGVEILVVQGKDGAGVNLTGAVATYADLPVNPGKAGASYVVQGPEGSPAAGKLFVWSGTEWPAETNGSPFKGDKGDTGRGYTGVTIAGDKLAFGASDGTTDHVTVPQIAAATANAQAAADSAALADTARAAAQAAAEEAADSEVSTAALLADANAARDTATAKAVEATQARDTALAARDIATAARDETTIARDRAEAVAADAKADADRAAASEANAATARDTATTKATESEASAANADARANAATADAQRAEDAAARAENAVNAGVADASATTKGGVRLPGGQDGELGGTWDHPTVTGWNKKADLVDGKIPSSQIPSIATHERAVVNTTAERLALTTDKVQPGDVCIQIGNPGRGTYFLQDPDPSQESSWVLQVAPTDAVTSVNGYTGSFVLNKQDIGLGNVDNTSDANKPVSSATQAALDAKASSARKIIAGTGLTGGGDLTADRTLSVPYGTTAGTSAQGNDPRLSDKRVPVDGSVGTPQLADGAVTPAKMGTGRVVGSANGTPASRTLWDGTQAQYDAIATKDPATLYVVF